MSICQLQIIKKYFVEADKKAPKFSQNKITPLPHQRAQKRKFEIK